MTDLARKRDRERLPVRDWPYTQRLSEGSYLTYRRGFSLNTWGATHRRRASKPDRTTFPEVDPDDYDGAKRKAEAWVAQLTGAAVREAKRSTIRSALEEGYLADLRRHGRTDAAKGAEWRFKKYVWSDPLAEVELEKATRDDFSDWRDRHREGRAARTVERQFRSVKAGLNKALKLGYVGNPSAWDLDALQDDVEDSGETAVFLRLDQRKALIAAAEPAAAIFLRALELTGARPHEMANAKVSDFNGETLRLAHRKGKPPKLRVRYVVLDTAGVDFFKQHARERLQGAWLFTEDGEQQWRVHMWARRIRTAIAAYNAGAAEQVPPLEPLPVEASAYSFRHSRISELLQLYGVDPLTVAAQTGTSLVMIEKAYLRFIPHAMREKLAGIKE